LRSEADLKVKHLRDASLENIRLGLKGLPGTNTLAYYKHSKIADVKSLMALTPGTLAERILRMGLPTNVRLGWKCLSVTIT